MTNINATENKLDAYRQWIMSIKPTAEGWEALVFPNGVFISDNITSLIYFIGRYVMNEVIILTADALHVNHRDITNPPSRERIYSDPRMIAGYILYERFPASQSLVCDMIGWKNHASYIHARKQVNDIAELEIMKEKVYKMYPFLENNKLEIY